ncbi:MAG: I78 family peptidase inhibitor [Alphaproteobacteria bacterium]|nr:I78 family peptidase inhibitor [Alphaproteobacteria bacterium]
MLKPIIVAAAFGALAACVAINVNEAPDSRPAGGAETCDASLYVYLVGQDESAIDRTRLPKAHRIVCAECMVTMDHNPNRLNLHLGTDKKVGSVRCG